MKEEVVACEILFIGATFLSLRPIVAVQLLRTPFAHLMTKKFREPPLVAGPPPPREGPPRDEWGRPLRDHLGPRIYEPYKTTHEHVFGSANDFRIKQLFHAGIRRAKGQGHYDGGWGNTPQSTPPPSAPPSERSTPPSSRRVPAPQRSTTPPDSHRSATGSGSFRGHLGTGSTLGSIVYGDGGGSLGSSSYRGEAASREPARPRARLDGPVSPERAARTGHSRLLFSAATRQVQPHQEAHSVAYRNRILRGVAEQASDAAATDVLLSPPLSRCATATHTSMTALRSSAAAQSDQLPPGAHRPAFAVHAATAMATTPLREPPLAVAGPPPPREGPPRDEWGRPLRDHLGPRIYEPYKTTHEHIFGDAAALSA